VRHADAMPNCWKQSYNACELQGVHVGAAWCEYAMDYMKQSPNDKRDTPYLCISTCFAGSHERIKMKQPIGPEFVLTPRTMMTHLSFSYGTSTLLWKALVTGGVSTKQSYGKHLTECKMQCMFQSRGQEMVTGFDRNITSYYVTRCTDMSALSRDALL